MWYKSLAKYAGILEQHHPKMGNIDRVQEVTAAFCNHDDSTLAHAMLSSRSKMPSHCRNIFLPIRSACGTFAGLEHLIGRAPIPTHVSATVTPEAVRR